MILRAIFWIAVVSFFMPREPDLGYGRPSAESGISGLIASAESAAADPSSGCVKNAGACAAGLSILDAFQGVAVHSLADVKADIEASKHASLKIAARD